ncbi:MAG: alpha/beta hydrolase [Kiritimatiellales bacterium]|nr:alpha/beta hydrolase [Kiritimatiellales bacterium]
MRVHLLLALSFCLLLEGRAEIKKIEGLTFARYGTRELQLDLFKPTKQKKPMPAIVCIHGGGWSKGNSRNFHKVAEYLAERNYVAVSISYRLSGEAPFPAQIQDCKAAVRWLRANAEKHGIDPKRIGAIGHSAGGHLAALLATSSGVEALEGDGGNAGFSSAIQAAVPMGAQSDLETDRIREMTAKPGAKIWHDFLGGSLDENKETYQLASPRRHLDPSDPPMLFITGELDNSDTHALPIRTDMDRLKIRSGLLIIPGAPHPFLRDKGFFETAMSAAASFFDENLL